MTTREGERHEDEDVDLKAKQCTQETPPVLPVDQDDEVRLCSDELAGILADDPILRAKNSKGTEGLAVGKDPTDKDQVGGQIDETSVSLTNGGHLSM